MHGNSTLEKDMERSHHSYTKNQRQKWKKGKALNSYTWPSDILPSKTAPSSCSIDLLNTDTNSGPSIKILSLWSKFSHKPPPDSERLGMRGGKQKRRSRRKRKKIKSIPLKQKYRG